MTKNITRIPICDGVTFHSIGEKRFKTGRLTAAMLRQLPPTRFCLICFGVPAGGILPSGR
jgi:hypothetical protein